MAGGDRLFKPSSRGMRDPQSNQQDNGQVVNPPRYAKMGGFTSGKKGFAKNDMHIKRPGNAK